MQAYAFSSLREGHQEPSSVREAGSLADVQVLALAAESRGEAIELLYTAYRGRVYGYLIRFLGDAELADDLTQDCFTKAYGAIAKLPRDAKLLPWLYRIATNAAIDATRRRKRITWLGIGRLGGTTAEPRIDDAHGRLADQQAIQTTLRTLPPESAAALLLHALEGYSYKEIAEIQGTTLTAVRSRIARARAAFKDRYEAPGS